MANALVIDIGSHKAEEVLLFEGCPHWTARNRLRLVRAHGIAAIAKIREIDRLSRAFAGNHRFRYVLVEPIMHPELLAFLAKVPSLLVCGVSSCEESGPIDLLMAPDSLGNSIVPSKPNLSGKKRSVFNVNFEKLFQFLTEIYVASGDCDRIVVRMNAEGVEGPIIEFLTTRASVKPCVLAGSIGDIRKCFGDEEHDLALQRLQEAGIPFVYLTSHPNSWASGIKAVNAALTDNRTFPDA